MSRIFDHSLGNISVAAKDICITNLWCYVSKFSTYGQSSDRHLFLFECIDDLQASKLHDVNIRRFNNQPIPSSRPLRVELPPIRPHSTSLMNTTYWIIFDEVVPKASASPFVGLRDKFYSLQYGDFGTFGTSPNFASISKGERFGGFMVIARISPGFGICSLRMLPSFGLCFDTS